MQRNFFSVLTLSLLLILGCMVVRAVAQTDAIDLFQQKAQEKTQNLGITTPKLPTASETGQKTFESLTARPLAGQSPSLEGPVDRATYRLGPLDQVMLSLWGGAGQTFPLTIGADGYLVIPTFGSLPVGDLSLDQAQSRVREVLRRTVKDTAFVTLNLTLPRTMTVHVTGDVFYPGPVAMYATERLCAAIARASGPNHWWDGARIVIRHRDGTEQTPDLSLYLSQGRLEGNPYLRDGDVVLLTHDQIGGVTLYVDGEVRNPGRFRFDAAPALNLLIAQAGGTTPLARPEASVIHRHEQDQFQALPVDLGDPSTWPVLRNGDSIMVGAGRDTVFVCGYVNRPVGVPFRAGWRIEDYISAAGGVGREGSWGRVYILRGSESLDSEDAGPIRRGDNIEVRRSFDSYLKEYLEITTAIVSLILGAKAAGVIK